MLRFTFIVQMTGDSFDSHSTAAKRDIFLFLPFQLSVCVKPLHSGLFSMYKALLYLKTLYKTQYLEIFVQRTFHVSPLSHLTVTNIVFLEDYS